MGSRQGCPSAADLRVNSLGRSPVLCPYQAKVSRPTTAMFRRIGAVQDAFSTMSINTVTLVGRAGRDPDVRYFESGSVVCKFSLAVDRRSRNSDQPDWFNLEMWGRTAEIAANYVRKGSLLGITGALKLDTWTDRATGAQRSSPVIRVDRLELLGSKRDNEAAMPNNYADDEF
jgi:single-strand DNA-binding protein